MENEEEYCTKMSRWAKRQAETSIFSLLYLICSTFVVYNRFDNTYIDFFPLWATDWFNHLLKISTSPSFLLESALFMNSLHVSSLFSGIIWFQIYDIDIWVCLFGFSGNTQLDFLCRKGCGLSVMVIGDAAAKFNYWPLFLLSAWLLMNHSVR